MILGIIGTQIGRTNRHLFWTNFVLLLIVAAVPVVLQGYVAEWLHGPYPMTLADLAKVTDPHQLAHKYVQIQVDPAMVDPQVLKVDDLNDSVNGYFSALHLANGDVLVIHDKSIESPLVGIVSTFSSRAMDDIRPWAAQLGTGQCLSVTIEHDNHSFLMGFMIAAESAAILIALRNLMNAFLRLHDPRRHPIARQIAHLGPLEEIAVAIDAEWKEGRIGFGDVCLTRSWLIREFGFGIDLLYLGDIVWAYRSEWKHKGQAYQSTVIFDNRGRKWARSLSSDQVNYLISHLRESVPWAIVGFDSALQAQWRRNRKEMLARVEEQRRQMENSAGSD